MKISKLLLVLFITSLALADLPKTLKIMVIDTGIDLSNTEVTKYTPEQYLKPYNQDTVGHGTHVSYTIVSKACPGVIIIPCKFHIPGPGNFERELECIEQAIKEKVNIINFSAGGATAGGGSGGSPRGCGAEVLK